MKRRSSLSIDSLLLFAQRCVVFGKTIGNNDERKHTDLFVSNNFAQEPKSLVVREAPNYISGFERAVEAYGCWPSFHDSPVLTFSRTSELVELQVEAWEVTSEVDSRGYFVLAKRHEIGFRFTGITSAELENFVPENILFELAFSPVAHYQSTGQFQVDLDSAMGGDLCGRFTATSGEVTFIRPSTIEQTKKTAA